MKIEFTHKDGAMPGTFHIKPENDQEKFILRTFAMWHALHGRQGPHIAMGSTFNCDTGVECLSFYHHPYDK